MPIVPDPTQGGFLLDKPLPAFPETEVVAELRGKWGFDFWEGPKFHLTSPHPGGWTIQSADQNALITGREDTVHIQGQSTLCVEDVRAQLHEGKDLHANVKLTWKSPKPELLDVSVPLKDASPGTVTIAIHQYGLAKPEELPLKAYAEAASLEHLTLSAGDRAAVLKGKRLDEVEGAELSGISFSPAALNRVQDFDQLELAATGSTGTLHPGDGYSAKVVLRDGRTLNVPATVNASRPQIDLLSKGVQHDDAALDASSAHPGATPSNSNDLPLQHRLVFFLRARVPSTFPRSEKVELAAVDGSFGTMLSLSDGSMLLEDAHTAVATIDPLARFGASAFGPIQLRAVSADGVTGDWVPVGTLVRMPGFAMANALRCPRNPAKPCQLTGTNLFLITAVAATPDMANAVDVPSEFSGTSLTVPNPAHTPATGGTGTLYVRLRDDPEAVQTLNLPVAPVTGSAPAAPESGSIPASANPGSNSPAPNNSGSNTPSSPGPAPEAAPQAAAPVPSTSQNAAANPH